MSYSTPAETRSAIKHKNLIYQVLLRTVLVISTLVVIYPLLWNFFASLKTNTEILTNPWRLPQGLHLQNYVNAITKARMGEYFFNSVFVVTLSLALLLVFSIPISYVLAKFKFPFARVLRNTFIACIFIQPVYIIVPLFLTMAGLRMIDSRFWLGVVYTVLHFPFTIFLISGYMRAIPAEYEEAAMMDGASYFTILHKVIVPLSKPGIITASILALLSFWNEYPLALTLITSEAKRTIPTGVANLYEVQRYATDWGALFAALVLVLIPTVVIFIFGQKRLTRGMAIGGLKG